MDVDAQEPEQVSVGNRHRRPGIQDAENGRPPLGNDERDDRPPNW